MAKTPGIKYTKDAKGNNRHVTFDLKQHGEALRPMLESLGAVEETEFRKAWKNGRTHEQVVESTVKAIKVHYGHI